MNQTGAQENHRRTHYQRAEDAPEQNAVLKLRRHAEKGKDQGNDKHVVHRQGQLDHVAGDEQLGVITGPLLADHRRGDPKCERHGHGKPDGRPHQRLAETNGVGFAMKHTEVQRQENQHCSDEPGPVNGADAQGGFRCCCGFRAGGEYHVFSAFGSEVFTQAADKKKAAKRWLGGFSVNGFLRLGGGNAVLGNHRLVGELWLFALVPPQDQRPGDEDTGECTGQHTRQQHEGEFVDRSATEEE